MDSWGPFPKSTFFFGFFPGLLKTAVMGYSLLAAVQSPIPRSEHPEIHGKSNTAELRMPLRTYKFNLVLGSNAPLRLNRNSGLENSLRRANTRTHYHPH